jgi:hypothetical protein
MFKKTKQENTGKENWIRLISPPEKLSENSNVLQRLWLM